MARIRSRVQVQQARINIERPPSIAPAVSRLAGQVQSFAAERLESKRLEQARIAAEAINFDRDEQGRLMAPKVPLGQEGNPIPSIYDEAFTQQVMTRYGQRLEQEARKAMQRMALENRNDPASFDAAADAYRRSISEVAHPFIKGKIDDAMVGLQIAHSNKLAADRTQWEYQRTYEAFEDALKTKAEDLTGKIATGASDLEVQLGLESIFQEYDLGIQNQVITGANRESFSRALQQQMSMAAIANSVNGLPNNDVAEAEFRKNLNDAVEGKGKLPIFNMETMRVEWVPSKEAYPNDTDRKLAVRGMIEYVNSRTQTRNSLENARHQAVVQHFITTNLGMWLDAIDNGYYVDTDPIAAMIAEDPTNEIARSQLLPWMNRLDASNREHMDEQDLALEIHYSYSGHKLILDQLPPEFRQHFLDQFETASGRDAYEWMREGQLGEFNNARSKYQAFMRYWNMFFPDMSNTKLPAHQQDFLNAMAEYNKRVEEWTADYVELNGVAVEDMNDEQFRIMLNNRNEQIRGLTLDQTPKMSQYVDEYFNDREHNPQAWTDQTWWDLASNKKGNEAELRKRLRDIDRIGVVPQSLINFANDVLGNMDDYWARGTDVSMLFDVSRYLFESGRLGTKAVSAFGERQTVAMNAVVDLLGSDLAAKPNKQAVDLVAKAMSGENVYRSFSELPFETQEEVTEYFDNYLIDKSVELWAFGNDRVSIFHGLKRGETLIAPREMREEWKKLAYTYANLYGLETDRGRKQALAAARDELKRRGWGITEYQITPELPHIDMLNPLPTITGAMGGFGEWVASASSTTPQFMYGKQTLENAIPNTRRRKEAIRMLEKEIAQTEVWKKYGGTATPRVGKNISLFGIGFQRNDEGLEELAWNAFILTQGQKFIPIRDDLRANANTRYFFSGYVDSYEKQRQRLAEQHPANMSILQKKVIGSFEDAHLQDQYRGVAP